MNWQYTPYALPFLTAALTVFTFAVLAWRLRGTPTAKSFALMMLGLAIWTMGLALSFLCEDLASKLLWTNVMYVGVVTVPAAFLGFVFIYTGHGEWLTRRVKLLLAIQPTLTLLLVWTNNWHSWYWENRWLDTSGPVPEFQFERGVWSWVNLGYTYAIVSFAFLLLIRMFMGAPRPYRAQVGAVLVGALGVLSINVIAPNRLTTIPTPIMAVFVVVVTGLTFAFGILRFRLLTIVPVARDNVIEGLNDGVIVLDVRQQIIDMNPAAQRIVGLSASQAIGQLAERILAKCGEVGELIHSVAAQRTEFALGTDDDRLYYDAHVTPLSDGHGRITGRVIVFREITDLKRAQAQLLQKQRSLAVLEEQDRLARELHDSLGQVLSFVHAQSLAACELVGRGEVAQAEAYLKRLASVALDSYADVRDYVLTVRTTLSAERNLFRTLEEYLDRFSQNYGIRATLSVPPSVVGRAFAAAVEVQLLRIIQESLSNVRKHARASAVRVCVSTDEELLHIVIEDDGCGFNVLQMSESGMHFGLRIMRERIEDVGGSLCIDSAPGYGTRVKVGVPWRTLGA